MPSKTMSSEVKLIVQNSVNINISTGNFKLNLAGNDLEEKRELFLSENDDFMIISLNVKVGLSPFKEILFYSLH